MNRRGFIAGSAALAVAPRVTKAAAGPQFLFPAKKPWPAGPIKYLDLYPRIISANAATGVLVFEFVEMDSIGAGDYVFKGSK